MCVGEQELLPHAREFLRVLFTSGGETEWERQAVWVCGNTGAVAESEPSK